MPESAGISYLTLPEALQDVFIRQRTGKLSLLVERARQELFFFSGQLYLAGDNPMRREMEGILAAPEGAQDDPHFHPRRYLERELPTFVGELANRIGDWDAQDLRFDETVEAFPDDLVGPVPTGALVMDLSCRGRSEAELLRYLGGLDTRYRATERLMLRRRIPELDAHEISLLDRLERAADLRTLIAEAGDETRPVVRHLARLEAVRLVVVEGEISLSPLSEGLLEDISARVLASLEERPIELGPKAHRARLSKLLLDYGRQSYFELLGVDGGSSADEIHRNYMELARLSHPSHAARMHMRDRGRRLEWLFSRLTDAYLVLSDPERSADYRRNLAHIPPPRVSGPHEKARRSERAAVARQDYRLAREHIEVNDFHYAIELLRQAVLADPSPEYYLLLGQTLERNPRWLHMAVDSLREAVALRPHDAELRAELSRVAGEYQRRNRAAGRGRGNEAEGGLDGQGLGSRLMRRLKGGESSDD